MLFISARCQQLDSIHRHMHMHTYMGFKPYDYNRHKSVPFFSIYIRFVNLIAKQKGNPNSIVLMMAIKTKL